MCVCMRVCVCVCVRMCVCAFVCARAYQALAAFHSPDTTPDAWTDGADMKRVHCCAPAPTIISSRCDAKCTHGHVSACTALRIAPYHLAA